MASLNELRGINGLGREMAPTGELLREGLWEEGEFNSDPAWARRATIDSVVRQVERILQLHEEDLGLPLSSYHTVDSAAFELTLEDAA